MQSTRRFPPRLGPGARVGLVAPSGPLTAGADLEQATTNVRSLGWEPVIGAHVLERDGYLAGSDEHRLADLNAFAADDSIDAVWCVRGGYGATRLLDGLDYEGWNRRPRALIGYSDITALHSAIGQRANIVSYHGPTARAALTPMTLESFSTVMAMQPGETYTVSKGLKTVVPGRARGRLAGGNLSLVAALVGTPYAWNLDGAILVLEDVLESVYRIDRMFMQLRQSGALDKLAGIVLGGFTEIPKDGTGEERPLERVLRETADALGVPCVMNFPIGHIPDHVTLPLGAMAELDADAAALVIER